MLLKRLYSCGGRPRSNQMIKAAFKKVSGEHRTEKSGTQLMILFFKDFPQHEKYFPMLRPLPNEIAGETVKTDIHSHPDCSTLRASDKLIVHATKVFSKIEAIVEAIGDDEKLHKTLKDIGKLHKDLDLPDKPFNDFKQTLSKFMEATGANDETQAAWDAKIPCIMDSIIKYKHKHKGDDTKKKKKK